MNPITAASPESKSPDLIAENIAKLKELFPDLITEGQNGTSVKLDVLKSLVGDQTVTDAEEKYGLNWHGKRKARQLALTPSTGTLRPCPEESVDWDSTQNLMIEGDNLEVLKLLQKSYAGKVKLIYIDPPYNTGGDFVYPDNFKDNIKNYLEITGQTGEGGKKLSSNPETSGRFHTDWLNMMYPRLKLARNLLRADGAICVSIDDNELHNLKSLMDDVFGPENFLNCVAVKMSEASGVKMAHVRSRMPKLKEYIVVYRRSASLVIKPQKVRIGDWNEEYKDFLDGVSKEALERVKEIQNIDEITNADVIEINNILLPGRIISCKEAHSKYGSGTEFSEWRWDNAWRIIQAVGSSSVRQLAISCENKTEQDICGVLSAKKKLYLYKTRFNRESKSPRVQILFADENLEQNCGDFWVDIKTTGGIGAEGGIIFPNGKKPLKLLRRLIDAMTSGSPSDLVLDFFAGSGTTGQAVLDANHEGSNKARFILVQLPEPIDKDDELAALGFDSVSSLTIARLKNVVTANGGGGYRVFKLDSTNIREWDPNRDNLAESLEASVDHLKSNRTDDDILFELLLKLGLDLCVPMEQRKIADKTVHSIGAGVLITCLDKSISRADAEPLALGILAWLKELNTAGDSTLVFRDSAFADDVAKTNLSKILEQHGIAAKNIRSL